ncbi:DUF488 domain-containing protein [Candidatus Saccharibacteria bacterium]|nr:DUF488 domain-containing protein [Candidatus Saccharibacteria bacterium]
MICVKRIYDTTDATDGLRVLVDRIWPRGLAKEKANIDLWLKNIAPSAELRRWFGHEPSRWQEFKKRYNLELSTNSLLVNNLLTSVEQNETVTLLYGARDTQHNNAIALREYLLKTIKDKQVD